MDPDLLGAQRPGEVVVVVTAMKLSTRARADLSEMLGDGYLVVDIRRAPATANIVLAPPASSFALADLRRSFPRARVLFAEVEDDDRGIRLAGPLSRALAAGPDGYVVAPGLESLVPVVVGQARLQLDGDTRPSPLQIGAPDEPVPTRDGTRETWLDLEAIDALVRRLLATEQPRRTQLWLAVVAESAIYLARHVGAKVCVDVRALAPAVVAELRERVTSADVLLSPDGPTDEQRR